MNSPRKKNLKKKPPHPDVPDADSLPNADTIASLMEPVRAFMQGGSQARILGYMDQLAECPPQVLLLEGGSHEERLVAAHYWAALLNCRWQQKTHEKSARFANYSPEARNRPCLSCAVCIRMITHLHRDCFFLDGHAASIKIDDVRAMHSVLGEPPREARQRIVIFREAQTLVEAAANALLKSFEEPRPATSFILLVPQRERLLPTLISRSLCLTLPWPDVSSPDVSLQEEQESQLLSFEADLCTFLQTGKKFLERTGVKGTVDAHLAQAVTGLVRCSLVSCIKARQSGALASEGLEHILARFPETRLRMLDEALAECQDSLMYGVNPTLILEWLATRMYLMFPRNWTQGIKR